MAAMKRLFIFSILLAGTLQSCALDAERQRNSEPASPYTTVLAQPRGWTECFPVIDDRGLTLMRCDGGPLSSMTRAYETAHDGKRHIALIGCERDPGGSGVFNPSDESLITGLSAFAWLYRIESKRNGDYTITCLTQPQTKDG